VLNSLELYCIVWNDKWSKWLLLLPIVFSVLVEAPGSATEERTSEPSEPQHQNFNVTLDDSDDMGQVTSVSQLSDVQPSDWAYQALQDLVERYGCIAGYPDGTFQGQSALTRYEFVAGLNACLDRSDFIATLRTTFTF